MKKIEKQIEELRKKENKLRLRRSNLEHQILVKVTLSALRKSVGKCFKYSNSYGGNSDRWPLYCKVISIDERDMTFLTIEFQRTTENIIEVKYDHKYNWEGKNYFERMGGWKEIHKTEYNRAAKSLLSFVNKLLSQSQ